MAKIEMKISVSMEETFDDFLLMKKSMGLSDKTLITYKQHLSAIKKHLPIEKPIEELERHDLEIMISSMRDVGLSANSIQSYTRTLKTFFTWCNEEGITNLNLSRYRAQETIKDTYTDRELELLLKKPNMRQCKFSEYRNWVIINLLLNNGCRASSIRNIKNKDVDLTNQVIYLRHTKNKKSQVIPLCSMLCAILSEYMRIRGGSDDDYLFSNDMGEQMTEYSPYALLINEGNYYMIASDIRGKKLYHFRVDRMKGVKIVYEERTGKDLFRNFDIENYTHRAFSMFDGVEMDIKLQFDNKLLDTVIERFGTGSDVYYGYVDEKHFIISTKVEVSSQFYSWLCGFGTMVKILSPQTAVEGYTEYLKEITNSYQVDDNC